jgi:hypothetical protein
LFPRNDDNSIYSGLFLPTSGNFVGKCCGVVPVILVAEGLPKTDPASAMLFMLPARAAFAEQRTLGARAHLPDILMRIQLSRCD